MGLSQGILFAWGLGTSGQLGDATIVSKSSPILVSSVLLSALSSPTQVGTSSWSAVSAGNNFTLALNNVNKLFAWGLNTSGQLSKYNTSNLSSPVQITSSSYTLVSAGGTHTTIASSGYVLFGTGLNTSGQLGDSTIITKSNLVQVLVGVINNKSNPTQISAEAGVYSSYYINSPTQIGTSSWTQVSLGATHTAAITQDASLYTWGLNSSGQLGDNTVVTKSSPTQVVTGLSYINVSSGGQHTAMISTTGIGYAIGNDAFGQVGDLGADVVELPAPPTVKYLVVAGGGAGTGAYGGGGGGGQVLQGSNYSVTTNNAYSISIGVGGTATTTDGGDGSASTFSIYTALPGYGGHTTVDNTGGASGSGYAGGINYGGGGGDSAVGASANSNGFSAGVGGAGTQNSITFTSIYYGGGGGGCGSNGAGATGPTLGGVGGGGSGGRLTSTAGTPNTGGGGGASGGSNGNSGIGQNGGSGIAIISYPVTYASATIVGVTYTYTIINGYRIYTFTSGSGTITF